MLHNQFPTWPQLHHSSSSEPSQPALGMAAPCCGWLSQILRIFSGGAGPPVKGGRDANAQRESCSTPRCGIRCNAWPSEETSPGDEPSSAHSVNSRQRRLVHLLRPRGSSTMPQQYS